MRRTDIDDMFVAAADVYCVKSIYPAIILLERPVLAARSRGDSSRDFRISANLFPTVPCSLFMYRNIIIAIIGQSALFVPEFVPVRIIDILTMHSDVYNSP